MRESELYELLMDGGDPAFVTGVGGDIRMWNHGAERLFGVSASAARGRPCHEILNACEANGNCLCSGECKVLAMVQKGVPVPAFEVTVRNSGGERRWVSVSILRTRAVSGELLIVHLLRDIHDHKMLELVTEKFLSQVGALTGQDLMHLLRPTPPPHFALTEREQEILKLLARGLSTREVSQELQISVATARNHIQHVLDKLSAHNRTEAVLAGIRERLI